MRGINQVAVSGNVARRILFHETGRSVPACTFTIVSDRHTAGGVVSARVKINAYGEDIVRICKPRLVAGAYVLVTGELMNRENADGDEVMEVRARDIVFLPLREKHDQEDTNHGG